MQRLPATIQVLYAELVAQLTALEAQRSIGHAAGTFVAKAVKGQSYIYFQHSLPGGGVEQIYLGRSTPALDDVVERYREARSRVIPDLEEVARLCAALRAGGAAITDTAAARVLRALADAAVFRLGGVLVGTQAFIILGNMLGVSWQQGLLRTDDLDIAGERSLAVAVPELRADIPRVLDSLEMGFLPVPGLSPREPSTSFKIRGRPLRVDVLTPATGRRRAPVRIERFGTAATPLPFLDFVLEDAQSAASVNGGGVLVLVPHPARFALHELITAHRRPAALQTQADKDLRQATQLIELLGSDRPGDLGAARAALERRGPTWKKALAGGLALLARRAPAARALLE